MPVYVRRLTKAQREWLEEYEEQTGLEPMHQEALDSGKMTFQEVAQANLEWFKGWADEIYDKLSQSIPDEEREV